MKFADLLALRGEQVVIELDDEELLTPTELQGRLIEADRENGLVVETKVGTMIVPMTDVLAVEKATPPGKIVRRTIRPIPLSQVKQHLLDRHGLGWDIVKAMTAKSCLDLHNKIDHSNLGHRHRAKEVD